MAKSGLNIGFDIRPSLLRPTGVGAYCLALADRLPHAAPDMRFFLFSASLRDRYRRRSWPPNATLVDRRLPVRVLNLAWNRLGWPSLDRLVGAPLDLVHSPHPLLVPGKRARQVVTLHDLFFLKHPEMTDAEVRRDYAPLVREHVARADGVICVSEHTASEARLLLDVPAEKIAVIPNGVDPIYRTTVTPEEVETVLARRRLPRGAILYVGTEEKRKNLVNLAMAYMGLTRRRRQTPPLVLVGPGSYWAQAGPDVGAQIRATGYLETAEIRALMAASSLLVLPSLEEGFGLPVAEAMAAGLPVVCSRGSALEEVAGGAAMLVNPLDTRSIAQGIERVLDSPERAAELRRAGLEQSRRYDWDTTAALTVEFYRKVLGN
ncbi:MAG TPA: glycosyltransferase family 1 protein [Vicinamibacteria bacterium]|jgi:glycosyltransferase involved in cell wall biosynthesis